MKSLHMSLTSDTVVEQDAHEPNKLHIKMGDQHRLFSVQEVKKMRDHMTVWLRDQRKGRKP